MRAANCMRDYGTTNNTPAHQAPPVWRAPEGLEDLTAAQVGGGRACQHTNDKPDRLEAAAVPVGPGRGAGGRRQGLAGLRDRPLRAKLACGDLAGGPPPTGTHSGPAQQNWPRGGRAWPGFEKTRRANHQHTRLHWCGGHRRELPRCRWAVVAPHRRCGGHRRGRPRCRWAAAGPGRASRSTTPSEARVWRSRGRGAAHRHQHAGRHAGTNTQPQIHRHNEAARPHRGRAAHASGRYAAISEVFSASGCRWRPGARRPRRRGRPCRPRPTCPTYAGRTAS